MTEFKGPFGLWAFPFLNYFLEMVKARSQQATAAVARLPYENEEYYKVVRDKTGSIEGIEIHRKVNPSVRREGRSD